jgi:hypothetical protein
MQSPVPLFTVLAIIVIVVTNRKRRRIFDAFRMSSATSTERAKNLSELDISKSILFANQVRQKVIVSSQDNKYYLDEDRLEKVIRLRRRIAFVLGVGLLIFAFILFLKS